MLRRLALTCYEHRRFVLVAWIVAVAAVAIAGRAAGNEFSQSLSLPGTESQRAADLLRQRFPALAGDAGEVVFRSAEGLRSPAVRSQVASLLDEVAHVPGVTAVISPYANAALVSRDGKTGFAQVQFAKRAFEVDDATTARLRSEVSRARSEDLGIELGGQMFARPSAPGGAEIVGLVAAVAILLFTFGSLLAMGMPIVTALFGIAIGLAFVDVLSHFLSVPDFTTQLASMVGIGVGIDYALFIVTRYRQGLHDGLEPRAATALAIDTAGRAVLFAGTTVVISLLGLFLMGVELAYGLALGTSFTVAVVMVASVTLLPALLGFAGTSIDRFGFSRRTRDESSVRNTPAFRWSRLIQRRPWPCAIGGVALLLVLALPLLSIRLGFQDAGTNPPGTTTRKAYDLLADGFGPGFNGPLVLAIELSHGTDHAEVNRLQRAIATTVGVAAVSPPQFNTSGDTAVVEVIPASSPQSEDTVQLVHRLRRQVVPHVVAGAPTMRVSVGGFTAAGIDISDRFAKRLPWFIAAVLTLSFLLLLTVFRSIVVPLKAVVMNLLSIGAAYGVVVAVFQEGWGKAFVGVDRTGPIAPFIPMMLFAIVFGLSMDYEVFLLSRVREEYDRTHDNGLAVADGLAATARVITAAAAIMITVFASFVLGDNTTVKIFGFGLAVAILIDATVVRMLLVPATMELLGDANWWFPRRLSWLPRLHVEVQDEQAAASDLGPTVAAPASESVS
jgi:RND superfamily putative drug exporter